MDHFVGLQQIDNPPALPPKMHQQMHKQKQTKGLPISLVTDEAQMNTDAAYAWKYKGHHQIVSALRGERGNSYNLGKHLGVFGNQNAIVFKEKTRYSTDLW